MMSEQTDKLIALLVPYGLTKEEAALFLYLQENKDSSALAINRNLKLARTKVYRILDRLLSQGLVTVDLSDRGKRFRAASSERMSMIISQKELEIASLKKNQCDLEQQLNLLSAHPPQDSKVSYYEGVEGLKQVTWNSLKARGELLTMEIKDMDAFFDRDYAEDLRLRFVEHKIHIRTLTNVNKIQPWTDAAAEMVKNYWEIRYIPKHQLDIRFEILIYNNIYTMYRYQAKKVFCVEIYNQELADMQRQIFDYMWQKAQRFRVLNEHGAAILNSSSKTK